MKWKLNEKTDGNKRVREKGGEEKKTFKSDYKIQLHSFSFLLIYKLFTERESLGREGRRKTKGAGGEKKRYMPE